MNYSEESDPKLTEMVKQDDNAFGAHGTEVEYVILTGETKTA